MSKIIATYIIGSYGIAGSCIYLSNTTNYKPKNVINSTNWDLLKINSDYGRTTSTILFTLSPIFVPIICIDILLIHGYNYVKSVNKKD